MRQQPQQHKNRLFHIKELDTYSPISISQQDGFIDSQLLKVDSPDMVKEGRFYRVRVYNRHEEYVLDGGTF